MKPVFLLLLLPSASFAAVPVADFLALTTGDVVITLTTATLGGHLTAPGAVAVIARGAVYALTGANADSLISGSGVTKVATSGTTGIFTLPVAGLASGSGYSFKAYDTNSRSTSCTAVATFTTTTAEVLFSNSAAAAGLTGDAALPVGEVSDALRLPKPDRRAGKRRGCGGFIGVIVAVSPPPANSGCHIRCRSGRGRR